MSELELQIQMQIKVNILLSDLPYYYIVDILKYFNFLINFSELDKSKLSELIVELILRNYSLQEYDLAINRLEAAIEYTESLF
ncbi:hypothetical protein LC593_30190 [Nostoc sp. CHAB 5844]|nr:hypothetical protein [Nostoc sp. CHAB 5844]